jgi:enoyl-CoA hydratase
MDLEMKHDVALVRMRFGKANAMSAAMLEALDETFARLPERGARAVVLTGDGRTFSAGLALPTLIDLDRAGMRAFIGSFARAMQRVFTCPLPVVAAIDGHAIAGGCVLALQADVRYLAEGKARIGLNEVQLGIGLPAAVLEPLKLVVPAPSLLPIALLGELVDPERARALGLVDALFPPEALEGAALERARGLARVPGSAFAQVKAGLRRSALEAWRSRDEEETERWLDTWFSGDAQGRLRAAVDKLAATATEKRSPAS